MMKSFDADYLTCEHNLSQCYFWLGQFRNMFLFWLRIGVINKLNLAMSSLFVQVGKVVRTVGLTWPLKHCVTAAQMEEHS